MAIGFALYHFFADQDYMELLNEIYFSSFGVIGFVWLNRDTIVVKEKE